MSSQDNSYSSTNEEIVRRLDAIKARHEIANSQPITDLRVWDSVFDVPALVAAVEAVLELHKMELDFKGRPFCVECDSNCHSYSGTRCDSPDAPFPCPTVTAIQSALGEGEK